MKQLLLLLLAAALSLGGLLALAALVTDDYGDTAVIVIYADRTLSAPLEEVVEKFVEAKRRQGVNVEVKYVYGSSGFALSQLEIAGRGDFYLADGMVYARLGVEKGLLDASTLKPIGVIRLALVVAEGNPKGVEGLRDALERGDVRLAIGNPEHVTAGYLAWRLLEREGLSALAESLVEEGRIVLADSASHAANLVMLGVVDAAITFNVYAMLYPDMLDEVYDPMVASVRDYVVIALPSSRGPLADELYEFLLSNLDVFYRYGVEPVDEGG